MASHHAAIELLERELQECNARAEELRQAINILKSAEEDASERRSAWDSQVTILGGGLTVKDFAVNALREHPDGMSTVSLWRDIQRRGGEVSNPNSLNVILNRHSEFFARDPEKPRYWVLRQEDLPME
ncbi:MAG: hypothetical protein H6922_00030 [Pseudomonadaceae bacterium]|nr:hypothetical protein [Pseudomonadaceae bacterium]